MVCILFFLMTHIPCTGEPCFVPDPLSPTLPIMSSLPGAALAPILHICSNCESNRVCALLEPAKVSYHTLRPHWFQEPRDWPASRSGFLCSGPAVPPGIPVSPALAAPSPRNSHAQDICTTTASWPLSFGAHVI